MTQLQRDIIICLFEEGNIATFNGQYRLRDNTHNPIRKFSYKTFAPIKHLLRRTKVGVYVINKVAVRQQRGNSWVKKYYKSIASPSGIKCALCERDPGVEGIVWNGFLDKDTGQQICNECREHHYRQKAQTEHEGLYSEFPVTITPTIDK